jgi:hypothetical protein
MRPEAGNDASRSTDEITCSDPLIRFLHGKDDSRSSFYVDGLATEFEVQGLGPPTRNAASLWINTLTHFIPVNSALTPQLG